ncbi:hypothetical protein NPS01_37450 [Nocardioides psychrotolerans]|nr:hypothetical protein NPS01_37450 [Nocardioides psychrotolerans]
MTRLSFNIGTPTGQEVPSRFLPKVAPEGPSRHPGDWGPPAPSWARRHRDAEVEGIAAAQVNEAYEAYERVWPELG